MMLAACSLSITACSYLPWHAGKEIPSSSPAPFAATPVSPAPAVGAPVTANEIRVRGLRLIGQQVLPRRFEFAGTVVGGLSGIDYDRMHGDYVLISDDRTPQDSPNPPRFYRARLAFDVDGFRGVTFTGVTFLRQPDGNVLPKVPQPGAPDPEGIRVDPVSRNLVWVSEGEYNPAADPPRVTDPFIREITSDGRPVREYSLPALFRFPKGSDARGRGPRNNAVFEGLSFTPDGGLLAVITEAPLLQDGAAPTPEQGALSRLTLFDRLEGRAVRQVAYPIDRVQVPPVPADAFRVNGPSEILALSRTRFLVLERSFSVGVTGNQVRLYEIEITGAEDVLARDSLAEGPPEVPVKKRLVLDFETLRQALGGIANLEGMTFGPRLANGHASLVLVADDNFPLSDSPTDRNQFLVFEVLPGL